MVCINGWFQFILLVYVFSAENLVYAKDVKAITHPEVGKYFEKFTGKFYVPNKMKQEEYPDDAEMTGRLVTQYFLSTK